MNWDKIVSTFGFIAVLSGLVRASMTPFSLIWGTDSDQELWAGLVACFLMAIGSIGLFLGQYKQAGVIGLLGSLLLALGNMMTACLVWTTMLRVPPVEGSAFMTVNNAVNLLGLVLLAIATFRGGVLPKWAAALLVIWPLLGFIPALGNWITLLWGLSYIALGYPIWQNRANRPDRAGT